MTEFGKQLQEQTIGVRLSINALGCRRTMSKGQLIEVANLFDADERSVSGSKAIINRKHELIKPIHSVLSDAKSYIRARTIDYPEQGLRLCRVDQIETLTEGIKHRQDHLAELVDNLCGNWASVVSEAKARLDKLFDESDYPTSPKSHYAIYLGFPEIKPDQRLMQLNPQLYAEQQAIIAAKFEEAVIVAEAAAAQELQKLLSNLVDKLKPDADGSKKILKGSAVQNISEFVDLFKAKTIKSNAGLEALMVKVQAMAGGLDADDLRKATAEQRDAVANGLQEVLHEVSGLIEAMPVREIDLD